MLHGSTSHPSIQFHGGYRRVTQHKCSSRHIHATQRTPQSRSHKHLCQAQRQRHRSGFRNRTAKFLCYSVAAAGSAGSNRHGPSANVQVRRALFKEIVVKHYLLSRKAVSAFAAGVGQATFSAETCSRRSARSHARVCRACSTSRKPAECLLHCTQSKKAHLYVLASSSTTRCLRRALPSHFCYLTCCRWWMP